MLHGLGWEDVTIPAGLKPVESEITYLLSYLSLVIFFFKFHHYFVGGLAHDFLIPGAAHTATSFLIVHREPHREKKPELLI